MKTTKIWMLAILFIAFAATSCSEDEDPVNEAQVLAEYLESPDGGGDYANTVMPAIMTAEAVKTLMPVANGVYIVDVRAAADYAKGHIEGAVNVPLVEVPAHLDGMDISGYDKVAIVCYSGQSAAWVTNICRIKGYTNVYSMKWGMSSWNADFDAWSSKTSNMYTTNFTTDATPKGEAGSLPSLSTGQTEGEAIMDARIDVVLAEGFGGSAIGAADVNADLDKYYILNYWPEAHYNDPGHLTGAMQYTPKESIGLDTYLKTLPTDQTIVVYCYTGQTSANLACYLRILGYDAVSLKFGCNSMIYDAMPGGKWSEAQIMGYDYVSATPAK